MNHRYNCELAKHRITQIKVKRIRNRYPRLYGKNAKLPEHFYGVEFLVCQIVTDQGASGWGLDRCNRTSPIRGVSVVRNYDDLCGRPVSELFDCSLGVTDETAIGLDFALHDLAGNILGIPVYEMLGSSGRTAVPCYDAAVLLDDLSPTEDPLGVDGLLQNCDEEYAMGYRAFKLKIGRGYRWMGVEEGLQRDIDVTRAVKNRFPNCPIMVDANDGYDLEGFLRYFEAVADCNLYWIEEPFPEDREDLLRLREVIARLSPETLVADGEANVDVNFVLQLAEEKLVDILLFDIVSYGFSEWRQLMPRVAEKGLSIAPHNWGLKIKTHYTGHLAAGYGLVRTVEGIPDTTEGVDYTGYVMEEGLLRVPNEPGFGMKLIWGLEVPL